MLNRECSSSLPVVRQSDRNWGCTQLCSEKLRWRLDLKKSARRRSALALAYIVLTTLDASHGALLRAGSVDGISLVIVPGLEGARGAPSVFDSDEKDADV